MYLEVVVHPRAHKLPEGVVRPLPDPAVNHHALRPEADRLGLEVSLLPDQSGVRLPCKLKPDRAELPSPDTHLHGLQHVSEHGALLLLVRLGSVLVAVGGQRVQLVAQIVPVLEVKVLRANQQPEDRVNMQFRARIRVMQQFSP